jgi:Fur family transcriptional regulator, ferric uptake regulator
METAKSQSLPKPTEKIIKRPKFDEAAFKQMIRTMGLKVTDQRLLVFQALHSGRAHVTAQEVYETVHSRDVTVGFATVYRFLRNLTEFGFVTEVRMGGLSARYELTPQRHHDHLTCISCGKICEFENHEIETLQERVAAQFGFKLTSHVLELYGNCRDCQKKQS